MGLPSWANDSVDVLRGVEVVERGTKRTRWDSPAVHTVAGCSVQPQAGAEVLGGREAIATMWVLFAPPGTDLKDSDRVRYAGDVYTIVGSVQRFASPSGRLDYVQAVLEHWKG